MKKGTELTMDEQKYVLSAYVHRFTKDHKPQWADKPFQDGNKFPCPYPVAFASDMDWLENTKFYVTSTGKLDKRHKYCESTPTWPDNPELIMRRDVK